MPEFSSTVSQNTFFPSSPQSSQVAEKICKQIQKEKLTPGTFLGTVQSLTDQYGVSRSVIREAVGSLRGLGIVTGRPKVGISVAQGDIGSILQKVLIPQMSQHKGWLEIARFRVVIEIGSMPLVLENIKPHQLDHLQELISEQSELVENQNLDPEFRLKEFSQKDMLFHEILLTAADQSLISQFHQVVMNYFQQGIHHFPPPTRLFVEDHQQIVDAIKARDPILAVERMTRHLQPVLAMISSLRVH
ncbi:MAG: FadR family transcriptional regulator [Planctomycetaceae bacterium]|nr:FadR family transcriptional regulator [Planctomycetaceae bacterium]